MPTPDSNLLPLASIAQELLLGIAPLLTGSLEQRAAFMFVLYDRNENGSVDSKEIFALQARLARLAATLHSLRSPSPQPISSHLPRLRRLLAQQRPSPRSCRPSAPQLQAFPPLRQLTG